MPTVLELAQADRSKWPAGLDGHSLVPMLAEDTAATSTSLKEKDVEGEEERPPFVVSQFHGDNIAMSWFLIVQRVDDTSTYKLIVWGTGEQHVPLLFNLTEDPEENDNLLATP